MPIRAHPYIIWAPYACAQVASGIPTYRADHCAALARLALDLQDALKKYKDASGEPVQVRGGQARKGISSWAWKAQRDTREKWGAVFQ